MLSNLETEKEKLLQIILVGQPELCQKLRLNELRQINQRVSVRYHILPLNRDELSAYIKHRLTIANADEKLEPIHFTEGAIDVIYKNSGGTPRMVNILCDRALLSGFTKETRIIDEDLVTHCIEEVVHQ